MNCDPIARCYRWLEYAAFGRALQRRRIAFLGEIADRKRVLILGDGDGRFLARFAAQNCGASIDYVDSSARMLELARRRAGSGRVSLHHADARTFLLANQYDLICTHFFLDCLNEKDAAELVSKIARACSPDARWVVSEFRSDTTWARWIVRALYFFFRLTTGLQTSDLVDYRALLIGAGFQMIRCESARAGLLVSELWTRSY